MEMHEYYQDLREYLGITDQDIETRGGNAGFRAAWREAWDAKPRTTPEAIRSVYNETDAYLFRNVWYDFHSQQGKHARTTEHVRRYCAQHANEVVYLVDYGCATGCLEKLMLGIENLQITLVDIPSPTLQFARWRFRNDKQVAFIEIGDQECLERIYDIVVCYDVLEHILTPVSVIRHLTEHHRTGGPLFLYFSTRRSVGWHGGHLEESMIQHSRVMDYVGQHYDGLKWWRYRKKA